MIFTRKTTAKTTTKKKLRNPEKKCVECEKFRKTDANHWKYQQMNHLWKVLWSLKQTPNNKRTTKKHLIVLQNQYRKMNTNSGGWSSKFSCFFSNEHKKSSGVFRTRARQTIVFNISNSSNWTNNQIKHILMRFLEFRRRSGRMVSADELL